MNLQITLKKSTIACLQVQKDTVAALGLRKVGQTVVKEDNPCIRGQIFRVKHMLEVVELESEPKKKAAKKTVKKTTKTAAAEE